jgi:hypothetical protein
MMKKWVDLISFSFLANFTVGLGLLFWCRGDRISGLNIVDIVGLMRHDRPCTKIISLNQGVIVSHEFGAGVTVSHEFGAGVIVASHR